MIASKGRESHLDFSSATAVHPPTQLFLPLKKAAEKFEGEKVKLGVGRLVQLNLASRVSNLC